MTATADRPDIRSIVTGIEATADAAGWDQPPSLTLICDTPTGPVTGRFPADGILATALHPVAALNLMTGTISDHSRSVPQGPPVVGVVLVVEAWMVDSAPGAPPPTGDFSEHPNRIESRQCLFAGTDGSTVIVARARGDAPAVRVGYTGRLLDAVVAFAAAVGLAG